MNTKSLTEAISALEYPGLSRTIGDLKLISMVKVTDGHAKIELLTVSA